MKGLIVVAIVIAAAVPAGVLAAAACARQATRGEVVGDARAARVVGTASAQERITDRLRKGIVEEEAGQDLDKAIRAYEAVVAQYDEERKAAGTALFRLAECYRKAGRRDQAIAAYQRVLREFGDQAVIVDSSRKQLATNFGIGDARAARDAARRTQTDGVAAERDAEADRGRRDAATAAGQAREEERDRRIVERAESAMAVEETRRQLERAGAQLVDMRKRFEAGLVSRTDLDTLEREVDALRFRYVQLTQEREAVERERQERRQLNERMVRSLQSEILLLEGQIASLQQKVQAGTIARDNPELLQLRRDLLELQRRLEEWKLGVRR